MSGLEAVIKSQGGVLSDLKDTMSSQNKTLVSINTTLNKIYNLDLKEARERRRSAQDAKRRSADKSPASVTKPAEGKKSVKEDKKEGGWIDNLLGFFGVGGILATALSSALGSLFGKNGIVSGMMSVLFGKNGIVSGMMSVLFGKKGILATGWNALMGKNGLINKASAGVFGKNGLIVTGWNKLVGKDGFLTKGWNKLVGKDGAFAKSLNKLKTKFPKLGTIADDVGKGLGKIGKFAKSAKGGGVLSGLISGGLKFAETGDTGQAVTQGAGAGVGALAGGAIGSLIAPGVGTAIGAAIGGIAGDFLTEELRNMGWLKPIEDSINGVVNVFRDAIDYIRPIFEGFIEPFKNTLDNVGKTFNVLVKVGKRFNKDVLGIFNGIKDTLTDWWEGFNKTIIKPVTKVFEQVLEFLKPILDPLEKLAKTIIKPLTDAFEVLFDRLRSIPIIGDLFGGNTTDDQKRGVGRGAGNLLTMGANFILNTIQDAGNAYVNRQGGGLIEYQEPLMRSTGGFTVPGGGFGDKVPMALPQGSFVLNYKAAQQFQKGGMVNTLLESNERVFLPGDPNIPRAMALNESFPRFGYQEGGEVPKPNDEPNKENDKTNKGKFEYPLPKGRTGTGPAQVFGAPRDGGARRHAGVDLVETPPWGADPKIPVVAPRDGIVSAEKYTTSGYTAGLILKQNDGFDTRYVHMTPEVKPDTQVKAGDRIGKLIDLKDQSHLHFELYKSGSTTALDPAPYLSGAGKTPGAGLTIPGMQMKPDGDKGEETGFTNPDGKNETVNGKNETAGGSNPFNLMNLLKMDPVLSEFFSTLRSSLGESAGILGSLFGGGSLIGSLLGGAPAAAATMDSAPSFMSEENQNNNLGGSGSGSGGGGNDGKIDPAGSNAKALLNTIRFAEGTSGPQGYNTWFGGRTDMDLTSMTINEVVKEQKRRLSSGEATYGKYKSAAVGAYQMMKPEVFARKAGFDPATTKFTPEVQDKMAIAGYMKGQAKMTQSEIDAPINREQIAKMAPVWASLPMLNGQSRYGQPVKSFESLKNVYYKSLGQNKQNGSQNVASGMQKGGIVNTLLEPGERVFLPGDPSIPKAMELNETIPRFGYQEGGVVGSKYMKGNKESNQDFRQANMKQMSQNAKAGSPVVIMNNVTQQSAPQTSGRSGGNDGSVVPTLPDEPQNNVWKSYYNFAQRVSIG